jgi:hypothetical protein
LPDAKDLTVLHVIHVLHVLHVSDSVVVDSQDGDIRQSKTLCNVHDKRIRRNAINMGTLTDDADATCDKERT